MPSARNPINSTNGETSEGNSAARENSEQYYGASEQISSRRSSEGALDDGLEQILPKAGRDHIVEGEKQHRQADERQDAGDSDCLHRRDPPPPHQHAEDGKETSGGNKQEIAADPVRAYGPQRFSANHRQAKNNDECTNDPSRRQRLLQDEARQDHAAQRCTGRLDNAAMAQRNKQITEIAEKRERQPAKHRKRESAPPSYAAEIAQAAGGNERQQHQSGPNVTVQRKDEGRHSDVDAMPGGNKTQCPAQRRTGTASHTQRLCMFYRR